MSSEIWIPEFRSHIGRPGVWLCDTETEELLWLTGMWNYSQICFISCIFIRDKFYCLDMLILVYKNLKNEVNKHCALLIMDRIINKASHKAVKLHLNCCPVLRQHLISKSGLTEFWVLFLLKTLWKTHINAEWSNFVLIHKANLSMARAILCHILGCSCWL